MNNFSGIYFIHDTLDNNMFIPDIYDLLYQTESKLIKGENNEDQSKQDR